MHQPLIDPMDEIELNLRSRTLYISVGIFVSNDSHDKGSEAENRRQRPTRNVGIAETRFPCRAASFRYPE